MTIAEILQLLNEIRPLMTTEELLGKCDRLDEAVATIATNVVSTDTLAAVGDRIDAATDRIKNVVGPVTPPPGS